MKKIVLEISTAELIKEYLNSNSTYSIAKKFNTSATAVKRLLKEAGVLRTQNEAAKKRGIPNGFGTYERTEKHLNDLSLCAQSKTGDKNPFFGKKHSESSKKKIGKLTSERIGERNPNYKDGKYIRRPRDFKIGEFTPIRQFVFNRDKYTCNFCKTVGGHLHAHHILPYWVAPEAFLDKNNLITVCSDCHFEKAHKSNWAHFDTSLITEYLLVTYKFDRERLNELALK